MVLNRRRSALETCESAGRVTANLLLSFLALSASPTVASRPASDLIFPDSPILTPLVPEPPAPAEHTFTLRHILHHGTYRHPGLYRKRDVKHSEAQVWLAADDQYPAEQITSLKAKSRAQKIERLVDRRPSVVDPLVAAARERGYVYASSPSAWTIDDVSAPDITDKETVLTMAFIVSNAYVEAPGDPDWEEVGEPFNRTADFGWETDGLRGHVWGDETNSTIVIGLKGTSPAVFDGEGTTTNDKINDNLFFSCCCAQQGQWTYRQVCNCATGTYACNNTCVRQALREENRYYQAARELFTNVTELYPDSNVWVAGHSLGGAVSSFVGLTYGVPVVTFEAVPEALAASRLGLPIPPSGDPDFPQTRKYTGAYHFGHTADPIYIGTCNGATATCTYGGYALETACHAGHECTYDTVADYGWRVGIGTHKIRSVINDVIKKYATVPKCEYTPECRDCVSWKMYESNSTDGTTTSSSSTTSKTRTRTATCQTPGWWGCNDKTTTTDPSTSTEATSTCTSTSTCKTPGWFGCKDKITTTDGTTTTTSTTSETTSTSTCKTPGWLGCNDKTSAADENSTSHITPTATSTSCATPGWLGCKDKTTTAAATTTSQFHQITSPPSMPPAVPTTLPVAQPTKPTKSHCVARHWYGTCRKWVHIDEDADRNWEIGEI
ncbi:Alpha/Beta hydrolase protein [Xylaria nigripes]|nr:Alpha/Beta hydrolase protein [Xylaria nigripes]